MEASTVSEGDAKMPESKDTNVEKNNEIAKEKLSKPVNELR